MRVTLNAVRLITLASSPKSMSGCCSIARNTTPGPLTPTLITQSGSPMPWNAPAMNGLSSTALQNTTSFAQPMPSRSAVRCAVSHTISPMRRTASMLMPARVVPTLTDAHTRSVTASASGIEAISASSPGVMPLCTSAENPPIKFTPTVAAARSSARANTT